MRILMRLPLNAHSGYGRDGVGMALAFRQLGCDVYLDPIAVQAPLPPKVAELLCKRLPAQYDLIINHWDPPNLGISPQAKAAATVSLAWTMWEMSSLDNCKQRSSLRKRLRDFDLVVGYDTNTTEALKPYVPPKTAQATVQGGFWPQDWPARPRDWDGPLNLCMVGALHERKGPFVAIEAFKEIRQEYPDYDIRLNLKTNIPGLHSKMQEWIPGLRIFYEVWPDDVMRDFYYNQHILLAPSRGEGKNMPALEMMSTGGTVIATNWGGHTQWLSPAVGYPLDYELEPLSPQLPNCLWAKASKDHLKQLILDAYRDRAGLRRRGETAAQLIPDMCAWPKAIDRLMTQIGHRLGERGQRVQLAYRQAVAQSEDSRQLVSL